MKSRLILVALGFWSMLGMAAEALSINDQVARLGAPTMPEDPSNEACASYQTRLNDWYREAQAEHRQCLGRCPMASVIAGKISYGSGRVGFIASCFTKANQRSRQEQVIRFLGGDKYDTSVAAMGKAADGARKLRDEILAIESMRRDLVKYSQLTANEQVDLNTKIAARINQTTNIHPLSKELTGKSLDYVAAKHKEVLELFDLQMKQVITAHSKLVERGAIYANLVRRLDMQQIRSANSETLNTAERAALQAERLERDRESERRANLDRERRQADIARRERELDERMAADRAQQEQMQAVFSGFMGVLGAMGGVHNAPSRSTIGPAYRPPASAPRASGGAGNAYRPPASAPRSSGSAGSSRASRCPAISERNPFSQNC